MTPDADADLTLPPATADADATLPPGDPLTATGDAAAAVRALNTDADATVGPGTSPPPVVDAPPGFVIERELGVGGMGVVYLARQVGLNRPVALKLVKPSDKVDSKALIRFLAEAEAVASIRHPNVVEVFQYGEHAGKPYMALEFCPGGDLTLLSKAEQVRDAGWFRQVAEVMAKVADGVNAAHGLGIVHRDLKPHNVFLAADGTPKVADFGLAKRGLGSDLTHTQDVLGTPAYMAPEQAGKGSKFVGPEADVWALGVMLYELCCGELPIDTSGNLLDTLVRVAMGEVSQLRTKAPTVPPDLALIAHKCLSLDPRDRYPTAGGLADDLRNWLDGKPISARPAGVVEQAVKWAKRNKKLAGMGVAVLLTMAVATGVSLGFGLEANAQTGMALREKRNAEDAAERAITAEGDAKRKAYDLTATLADLEESNERANRTLAKAMLGPISPNLQAHVTAYEQEAFWTLAELRGGPVGRMLLEEATSGPLARRQYVARAELLVHAAVGLDRRRWAEAQSLIARCLSDPILPAGSRRDLATSVTRTDMTEVAADAVGVLQETLLDDRTNDDQRQLAVELEAVAARLPADRAAAVCGQSAEILADVVIEATGIQKDWRHRKGLALVSGRLPADRAAAVCGRAAEGLAAVTRRLPADRAAAVCGRAAEGMLAALREATNGCERQEPAVGLPAAAKQKAAKFPRERRELAHGLAAVAGRLPAERAAAVCELAAEMLTVAFEKEGNENERRELARGLAAVAGRLPAERAAAVCAPAARVLADDLRAYAGLGAYEGDERWQLAQGLVEVTRWLPAEEGVTGLRRFLEQARSTQEKVELARGLAAMARRLPAERGASELRFALKTTGRDTAHYLASGLAEVAERLSAERGVEMLRAVIEGKEFGTVEAHDELVAGLAVMALRLPMLLVAVENGRVYVDPAVEVWAPTNERAASLLASLRDGYAERAKAKELAAVAQRLTGHEGVEVLTAALERAGGEGRRELAAGLTAVTRGRLRNVVASGSAKLAALVGGTALDLFTDPEVPRLPPQQLVELLKHPFVVREARRAVLDALEFTYERTFADLWAFVAFAEKEHPELDLLTPPKRPERK